MMPKQQAAHPPPASLQILKKLSILFILVLVIGGNLKKFVELTNRFKGLSFISSSYLQSSSISSHSVVTTNKNTATATSADRTSAPTSMPTISSTSRSISTNIPSATPTIKLNSSHTKTSEASAIATTGGLFHCGWSSHRLGEALFPEYAANFVVHWGKNDPAPATTDTTTVASTEQLIRQPTAQDILVFGQHGPCPNNYRDFPGKVLFRNAESHGDVHQEKPNYYQLGSGMKMDLLGRNQVEIRSVAMTLFGDLPQLAPFILGDKTKAASASQSFSSKQEPKPINTGEYNAVAYISRNCVPYREAAVKAIAQIMPIHYGSTCRGDPATSNADQRRPMPDRIKPVDGNWRNVIQSYHNYRFCLVMENTRAPYYITEKILTAFGAGCLPIYYGTTEILDIFHRDAFVFYNVTDPQTSLEELRFLYQNETAYWKRLKTSPLLAHGNQTLRDYFSLSDHVGGGYLKGKIRTMMGLPN